MSGLAVRRRENEAMDDPGLDRARHLRALRGLERINTLSGSAHALWAPLLALAQRQCGTPVRVLDIASGAGDIPIAISLWAGDSNLPLVVDGCDRSPFAVSYARAQAAARGAKVRFFQLDAERDPLPSGYDALLASLFLHHLDDDDAVRVLRSMGEAAGRLLLIDDLVRSEAGYWLAWLGTRVLTRSEVAWLDGPRSVRGSFTPAEAVALAERAGLVGAHVERHFPQRYLLSWWRP